jgi:hypothetical protein
MKALIIMILTSLPLIAKEGAVQCGNLIYAGTRTSQCFSDEFLSTVQQKTTVSTERRFKAVKLADDELFKIPFVIMTGVDDFSLPAKERENLKKYLENGGFLLASASCSNEAWSKSFEREIKSLFGNDCLKDIPLSHEIFRTVYTIKELGLSHGGQPPTLKGLTCNGKIVVVYTADGLNDSSHAENCCCCGGNEIIGAMEINVNILTYALLH